MSFDCHEKDPSSTKEEWNERRAFGYDVTLVCDIAPRPIDPSTLIREITCLSPQSPISKGGIRSYRRLTNQIVHNMLRSSLFSTTVLETAYTDTPN